MGSVIKKWLKNRIAAISIAVSNVEKQTFSQEKNTLSDDTKYVQRHQQGSLADALMHGEVTQEVKNLRWRTYKILKSTNGVSLVEDKIDEDGDVYYKTRKVEQGKLLRKVILDTTDDNPLEMVVMNNEITLSNIDMIDELSNLYESPIKNTDENDELVSASHGEIKADEFFIKNKGEKQIKIIRNTIPKFYIERYTKKLNIRTINETEKLLEFYISKYPDEYNKTQNLFLREIDKLIKNGPRLINFLDVTGVEFITENTLGSEDFLYYNYDIKSFDKIIEFDGNYVIKFIGEIKSDGSDIFSKYIELELEKKYENKERKN